MSASVGCSIEKYMGRRRSKEEYKMLEAVLSSTSNRIAISEKFRIIPIQKRLLLYFLLFSSIGFVRSKLRLLLGPTPLLAVGKTSENY